jgi:hypothetical protein
MKSSSEEFDGDCTADSSVWDELGTGDFDHVIAMTAQAVREIAWPNPVGPMPVGATDFEQKNLRGVNGIRDSEVLANRHRCINSDVQGTEFEIFSGRFPEDLRILSESVAKVADTFLHRSSQSQYHAPSLSKQT